MLDMLKAIKTFLLTDVKNRNETKELAVLIRLTCCIFILYYLIVGILIAFLQHYFMGLILIAAIGLLIGSFICTYEDHTFGGLILLNIVLVVFSSLLAINLGFGMDFHLPIFLVILLIFFNKSDAMKLKKWYSIGICILLMCLVQFCNAWTSTRVPKDGFSIFIQSMNILVFSTSIGAIAYSYCIKFNQAEDKLKNINDNLVKMANLDTLTGLSNRRHMNEHMASLVSEYNRSGNIFTIAIGDVDFFKKVNDTYGHNTGDYVLTKLATEFTNYMKDKGHVARWGGEEFLFSFENMNITKAYACMDELRRKIENMPMNFREYHFNITMTYGMEEFNNRLGVEATINRADEKLYKGKTSGRNMVVK
ncbi:MAG TPA: diguanylate cyclase [Lachnospiraceae bacterium]|nr:diguanylate cyclase [Lachnospiraceae bacterium]